MVFLYKKTIFIYMGSSPNKFVDYFAKPLTQEQLSYLNKLHEVSIEKCEVFRDFAISLQVTIYDTFLGDDVINTDDKLQGHFNWCWTKILDDFSMEDLFFAEKGEHYYYFLNFFTDTFYNVEYKDQLDMNTAEDYWFNIMRIDGLKTKSQYDVFIQTYKILNEYFLNND